MSQLTATDNSFKHLCHYGELVLPGTTESGELPDNFTMNSPVGVIRDNYNHVWVCDTGNSRILVFTADLNSLLHVIDLTAIGTGQQKRLMMPFHLCPHPDEDLMYATDMGNGRVVVFTYDEDTVDFRFAFGDADDGINGDAFVPLSDPNGITIVREASGEHFLYVCDEFFHTGKDVRSRCVKFTLGGKFVLQFRAVVDPDHTHDLLWPQGLASDSKGCLYLANTGYYQVLKIDTAWPVQDERVISPREAALLHSFGNPAGIGKFNVMRSVCVIDDYVFVPGQVENAISIYNPDGKLQEVVEGMNSLWNHKPQAVHSFSDFVYGALEDTVFVGPYQICAADVPDTYYITEPFASTVLRVRIPSGKSGVHTDALLLDAVGHRRDNESRQLATSQFNCMTSVLRVDPKRKGGTGKLPDGGWLDGWAKTTAGIYQYWYDQFLVRTGFDPLANVGTSSFNIDSGNWCLKTFNTAVDPYAQLQDMVRGFFAPGDLAMAAFYPSQPLLGQICPGTPLVFITNFNMSTVSMYQFGPNGHLLNYGVPFGIEGIGGDGTLKAPQGLAVNSHGEIFIADSLNNRISKWQLQATGVVRFVKNIVWEEDGKPLDTFTPCDLDVDAQDRVFVCDQFNNCLRVFDRHGASLWTYGQAGYCDDLATEYSNFYLPASLCIDEEDNLIVNDLVNRALKIFKINGDTLDFVSGDLVFKKYPEVGGVWMPFFIYAHNRRVYVPDTTFNVVNVYSY
jgi:DNA-binding beta-propeller fold protein YncE